MVDCAAFGCNANNGENRVTCNFVVIIIIMFIV